MVYCRTFCAAAVGAVTLVTLQRRTSVRFFITFFPPIRHLSAGLLDEQIVYFSVVIFLNRRYFPSFFWTDDSVGKRGVVFLEMGF